MLIGHIARGNPQLAALSELAPRALAVFEGPWSYVAAKASLREGSTKVEEGAEHGSAHRERHRQTVRVRLKVGVSSPGSAGFRVSVRVGARR